MRHFCLMLIGLLIAAASMPAAGVAQTPIRVVVDGAVVSLDPPPVIIAGRVLVPLRGVFERIEALVDWKPVTQTIVVLRPGIYVELRIGTRTASVNGTVVPLDTPARMVRGRVFIPLRFVSEALGVFVVWRAADRTVLIATKTAGPVQGNVAVASTAAEYAVGQPIVATVANGTTRPIYTEDSKTDCSIVTLERRTESGWEVIAGCRFGRPPLIVEIKPGQRVTVKIDPKSVHLSSGGHLGFGAGTYRFRFAYSFVRLLGRVEAVVRFSPEFQIRSGTSSSTGTSSSAGTGTVAPAPPTPPATTSGPDLGSPVATTPGRVTLRLDRVSYPVGTDVHVTIANGLERTIYALDEKSDCSIATLQRWTGAAWENLFACNLGRTPFPLAIGPGRGRIVTIRPFGGHWPANPARPGFGPGLYRIRFTYRLTPPREGEDEPGIVYSPSFRVI